MPASRHLVPVVLALVAACGGGSDPSGPTTASLAVTVAGLPSGTSAEAMVTGPGGYSHSLGGSRRSGFTGTPTDRLTTGSAIRESSATRAGIRVRRSPGSIPRLWWSCDAGVGRLTWLVAAEGHPAQPEAVGE